MPELCFLDMDGVLADFVSGIHLAHNRPNIYETDPQRSAGVFDIETLWGISTEEFWAPSCVDGFWRNLHKMPEADQIVQLVTSTFGTNNVAILTFPSDDARCVPEKKEWISHYYPDLLPNMLFGSAKKFLAGPSRYLLDDRDKNIESFRSYGGTGILVPRPWNSDHGKKVMNTIRWELNRALAGL